MRDRHRAPEGATCRPRAPPLPPLGHPPPPPTLAGAYGFPAGLLMICILGGELFTGNAFLFAAALRERRASSTAVACRLAAAWLANFAGAAAVALAMAAWNR